MNYSIQPSPLTPQFSAFFIFEISPSRRNFARGFATFIFELRIIARFILISLEKDAEMHESRPKIGGFDRQPRTRSFFPIPYPFSRELTRKSFEIFNDRAWCSAWCGALCIRVTAILHCLPRKRFSWKEGLPRYTKHRSSTNSSWPVTLYSGFTIASLSPFKMAKRKSRRVNPVPRFYFSPLARIDPSRGDIKTRGEKRRRRGQESAR